VAVDCNAGSPPLPRKSIFFQLPGVSVPSSHCAKSVTGEAAVKGVAVVTSKPAEVNQPRNVLPTG
jgi:hypothetical protein